MKYLTVVITALTLTACSFSGFKPPTNTHYWGLPSGSGLEFIEYTNKRSREMRECGIDPFIGSTSSPSERQCMVDKGWVYKKVED